MCKYVYFYLYIISLIAYRSGTRFGVMEWTTSRSTYMWSHTQNRLNYRRSNLCKRRPWCTHWDIWVLRIRFRSWQCPPGPTFQIQQPLQKGCRYHPGRKYIEVSTNSHHWTRMQWYFQRSKMWRFPRHRKADFPRREKKERRMTERTKYAVLRRTLYCGKHLTCILIGCKTAQDLLGLSR